MKFRAHKPVVAPSGPVLPDFVAEWRAHGATKGERNATLYRVAQQYFAAGLPVSQAQAECLPRALADGLGEAEARAAIDSAYRSTTVVEPITRGNGAAPRPAPPRKAEQQDDFLRALAAAFLPDEYVAVCDSRYNGEKWVPDKARIRTRREWEEYHAKIPISRFITGQGGGYIGINPLATASGRGNDNVAAYRHVLAEFDDGDIEEQRAKLEGSGFPLSLIVTSGKRSVHGWVRVDARDKREWEERRDHIFATLGCDPKNRDLARVSRCPGAIRYVEDKPCPQALLATHVGPPRWPAAGDAPALLTFAELKAEVAKGDGLPDLIEGLLSVRSKMMIAGPSKARKSWTLLDLALSIASGSDWLGFPCRQGKVIFIDGELHKEQICSRVEMVAESRGLDGWQENLRIWPMRGQMRDVTSLVQSLMVTLMRERPAAVFLDPIYKMLGDRDENAAGEINDLLNELEKVAQSVGCCVIYSHHYAKGDAGEKSPIDRASGSGVWARDPDAMAFFTPPPRPRDKKEPPPAHDFEVHPVARGHKPTPPFKVALRGAHFERIGPQRYTIRKEAPATREGSLGDALGAVLFHMPALTKPAAIEWLKAQAEIPYEEAARAWTVLSLPRRGFVRFDESTGLWIGLGNAPF